MAFVAFYDHRTVHDILHNLDFKPYFVRLFYVFAVLLTCDNAMSATASRETDYAKDWMFGAAKRYLLSRLAKPSDPASSIIHLEDQTAGIIRFSFKDGSFSETSATLEFIELDSDRCRLRLTFPSDFSGRTELTLRKLLDTANQSFQPSNKDPLPFEVSRVYQSTLRYLYKKFVSAKQTKEDVVKMESKDVGLIRFVYHRGSFIEPDARIEVFSQGKGLSRIRVTFPSNVSSQQILFEDELTAAVKEDLGIAVKPEEIPEQTE